MPVYAGHVEVEHDSDEPPYRQVAREIRGQIQRGELTGTVPSITTLMQTYGVARNTVRKAVELLRTEGLVRIVPGWGTFAVPPGQAQNPQQDND